MSALEERIPFRNLGKEGVDAFHLAPALDNRDEDARQSTAGDVTRCGQHAGTSICIGGEFILVEIEMEEVASAFSIHEPANQAADEHRHGSAQLQVNAHSEGERRY